MIFVEKMREVVDKSNSMVVDAFIAQVKVMALEESYKGNYSLSFQLENRIIHVKDKNPFKMKYIFNSNPLKKMILNELKDLGFFVKLKFSETIFYIDWKNPTNFSVDGDFSAWKLYYTATESKKQHCNDFVELFTNHILEKVKNEVETKPFLTNEKQFCYYLSFENKLYLNEVGLTEREIAKKYKKQLIQKFIDLGYKNVSVSFFWDEIRFSV